MAVASLPLLHIINHHISSMGYSMSSSLPVLLSLLCIVHESIEELLGILLAELLSVRLQSLHGLLVLLFPLLQVLPGELQEALTVDGPA